MTTAKREIEVAIEVFVHGYRADKSRTWVAVLMATHAGALLYSRIGYERIGTLLIFGPKSRTAS